MSNSGLVSRLHFLKNSHPKREKKKPENTHTTKGLVAWDRPVVPEVRIAAGNEGHKT